jgi:hypothetical protein
MISPFYSFSFFWKTGPVWLMVSAAAADAHLLWEKNIVEWLADKLRRTRPMYFWSTISSDLSDYQPMLVWANGHAVLGNFKYISKTDHYHLIYQPMLVWANGYVVPGNFKYISRDGPLLGVFGLRNKGGLSSFHSLFLIWLVQWNELIHYHLIPYKLIISICIRNELIPPKFMRWTHDDASSHEAWGDSTNKTHPKYYGFDRDSRTFSSWLLVVIPRLLAVWRFIQRSCHVF